MNPTVEMRLPGRPLISRIGGSETDASDFYQVLAEGKIPDLDVERFAAEEAYDLRDLGEGEVLCATSHYLDRSAVKVQQIEITRSGEDYRVQFVGSLAVEGDIAEESDQRPTGFTLSSPINGNTSTMELGNDFPGLKHGYFLGGKAYFEDDNTEYPNWAFGPIDSVTVLPIDS